MRLLRQRVVSPRVGSIRAPRSRACRGREGITPLYFVEVPGFENGEVEQQIAQWVDDLRQRNFATFVDLRPWELEGLELLQREDVRRRLEMLDSDIDARLNRITRALEAAGSVHRPNQVFVGRQEELRKLRHILTGQGTVPVHQWNGGRPLPTPRLTVFRDAR